MDFSELLDAKRAEAVEELRVAFAELESGEGLTRFVGGHGIQSRVFEYEWSDPALEISFRIPYARVLSDEATQKEDDEEIGAAIRMAILLLTRMRSTPPTGNSRILARTGCLSSSGLRPVLATPRGHFQSSGRKRRRALDAMEGLRPLLLKGRVWYNLDIVLCFLNT